MPILIGPVLWADGLPRAAHALPPRSRAPATSGSQCIESFISVPFILWRVRHAVHRRSTEYAVLSTEFHEPSTQYAVLGTQYSRYWVGATGIESDVVSLTKTARHSSSRQSRALRCRNSIRACVATA